MRLLFFWRAVHARCQSEHTFDSIADLIFPTICPKNIKIPIDFWHNVYQTSSCSRQQTGGCHESRRHPAQQDGARDHGANE